MVYANNIHAKQMLCFLASPSSDLEQCTNYDWRATAMKLFPKVLCMHVVDF